ncbi:hypothetical protein [Helicobacter marmotae]|nr:hypothetical protein [Helicobacter marmotae]
MSCLEPPLGGEESLLYTNDYPLESPKSTTSDSCRDVSGIKPST